MRPHLSLEASLAAAFSLLALIVAGHGGLSIFKLAGIRQQGAATQEIVRNVSQAATGTGEVTSNIVGVATAAEKTGAAASQMLVSATEPSRQSEHLAAEVSRFLATVRAA